MRNPKTDFLLSLACCNYIRFSPRSFLDQFDLPPSPGILPVKWAGEGVPGSQVEVCVKEREGRRKDLDVLFSYLNQTESFRAGLATPTIS